MRKRNIARAIAAGALALALAACGAEEYMEDIAVSQTAGDEDYTLREHPWYDADSIEQAAELAGFDSYADGAGTINRLGSDYQVYYMATLGRASSEIVYESQNVDIAVHKGVREGIEDVDSYEYVFYDTSKYAHSWTQQIGDVEVRCYGNREGESTKTIWSKDGYDYAIFAFDLSLADDSMGLSADDLAEMVPNIG